MNRKTARLLLKEEMSDLAQLSYAELIELMKSDQPILRTVEQGPSSYQIEIEIRWDGSEEDEIRVCGAIDAGGILPSIFPTCFDFVVTPNGERFFQI